ncbi:DUF484 family protein [Jannaschia aquimarina]|uniref:DUF484 domain-containing protein n=1 Tax=Jannaschia aquimarina TaxID=935700 RepID=A0A0D1ECS3_9RHOB|nr:DUF484 family protein [Jannaschia aquimarina]KIT15524.1 hypothetical protein jaqu_27720 [Jannaschia aquimarina]SNT34510.1 hypothetical protein SAMN05421775_11253 [Jannaschia aquimarina]
MTADTAQDASDWRDRILTDPEMILDDRDLMRALIAANEAQMGKNIVDMRGIAMERLEARLDRLEDTHRNVIAAAYENLSGMNQIHRCVLQLLDCATMGELLDAFETDIAPILRVDRIRLVLESADPASPHPSVTTVQPGEVMRLVGRGGNLRPAVLRQCAPGETMVFGNDAQDLRSEAFLTMNLGPGRLPALLAMGSEDPHQFRFGQGTDLLVFLAETLSRILRRHLDG